MMADSAELIAVRDRLAVFLDCNPESSVAEVTVGDEKVRVVRKPWGDSSLSFRIPDEWQEFCDIMNALLLPHRFTAIYHKDTRRFEIIWTAYRLNGDSEEVPGRKFSFAYGGKTYKCHFGESSSRLLTLAEAMIPLKMSSTSFRNLQSFRYYVRMQKDPDFKNPSIEKPISFWIDGIDFDTDHVVELINNLNFYLSYYDTSSPIVALHQVGEDVTHHPRNRYIAGKFPARINGKKLDNNLLSFWEASAEGDYARRFQYYYRIIEYASFFYLEGSARTSVRRILSAPEVMDDIGATTEKLMAAFQTSRLDDFAKFSQLIQDTIDPAILWREIKGNIPAFSKDFKFDGGFVLKAIISSTAKESTFLPKGLEVFTKAIRDIRNALSHGRDFKSSAVIMPTARNLKALQPWVHLIAVAAGQVVLYKDVT